MRPARLTRILVIGLVALGFCTQTSSADNRKTTRKSPTGQKIAKEIAERKWSATIEGADKEKDLAEQVALVRSQQELLAYLATQKPRILRTPTTDYIKAHLVKDVKLNQVSNPSDLLSETTWSCQMELEMDNKKYSELLAEDRRLGEQERLERVHERMFLVGKFMAALVALFGVVAVYFRIEEATKGYYTTLLRIAAASFVGAVGAGLWFIS